MRDPTLETDINEAQKKRLKTRDLPKSRLPGCRQVFLVFGAACLVRLMHIISLKASPIFTYKIGDAGKYDAWARSLAEGNWLGEGVFYQAPLYPYFLGVIYSVLGDDILGVRLVQSLLGAFSCVFLMLAATNWFGKKSGLISGLCLAFYAPSIFLEGLIQKSTLDLFFLTVLLWLLSLTAFKARPRHWIGIGVATGALCLTRENALVLLPVFALWIFFVSFNRKTRKTGVIVKPKWILHRMGWMACFAAGLALTLGPVAVRNLVVGGQFHLTTSQLGPNFYIGNNPDANGTYHPLRPGRGDAKYEQKDAVALAEKAAGRKLSPKEVSRHYLDLSFDFIREQPIQWLRLTAFKAGLTFNRYEIIDTEDQYTVAKLSPALQATDLFFNFGLLMPFAVLGIWVTRARWRRLWVIYLILAAFSVTVIAFFVFGRYRFPLAPTLLLFAGPAVLHLMRVFQFKNYAGIATSLAVMMAVYLGCNLNLVSPKVGRGITLSNYGAQALIRNDFENAERFLLASVSQLPQSALVHNNMGVLYRETSRYEQALEHFEKAFELEPTDDVIRRNLERLKKQITEEGS